MDAKKNLLGGMSLNGQTIRVGGINKATTGMPVGLFSIRIAYRMGNRRLGYVRAGTLIELMVVIAIIGVLAAASLLSFTTLAGERLEADTRKVAADLCWARHMAVATHQNYIVDFDIVNERYVIYRGSIAVNNQLKSQNLIVDLVSVIPGPAQITFSFPQGTASTQQINLGFQGKAKQVNVFGNTGYVKIQ